MKIELGISTFGETTPLENTGIAPSHPERIRQLVKEIELADRVGLDIYGIGEHHRSDFAVSAPEIILAAGAVNTKHIRLSSAVTVLSSIDPVRAYQQYATIDALSNGRAEMMVGRGSFTESFPLFGYDLKNYEALFTEKLQMLRTIVENETVTWEGHHTQSLDNTGIYPRSVQEKLPIWVATGGNVESTVNIARQGLPITYAIIGGNPLRFKSLIEAYHAIGKQMGYPKDQMQVAAHSWGFIADTSQEAKDKYFYPTKLLIEQIAKDRSNWVQNYRRQDFDIATEPGGAMFVGSPEEVTTKLIKMIEDLGLNRFMLHLPIGSMEHEDVMHAIELFGTQVAPAVRDYFKDK
ncbi:LLM class flavin-dependent oxidoreductase [Erysipelothrix rhusiopathiae]|uniref:LLM class flavin-dependent oxidoreductase n=1 Tax=Erysipelothrix rhusiopathiae TaxID=1648 RepID=UPI000F42FCBF|nr:LLM class flavin-dependent oxidoreductase [Erysipelothrix rhusiopathiae]AYV34921.1 LLM class flavin-dependent oxidoreductase [Erysipelothrix rhusiopathiae]MDE8314356.1 LLM class flavin-dependent oxidoreductase [Erysipelothrix rhusiopathiae]MDE8329701.1 LLM class flavin-dependent oxidoreductase [Erysipelothrix rhusiopathiae]